MRALRTLQRLGAGSSDLINDQFKRFAASG
jgi:hypothetical protein